MEVIVIYTDLFLKEKIQNFRFLFLFCLVLIFVFCPITVNADNRKEVDDGVRLFESQKYDEGKRKLELFISRNPQSSLLPRALLYLARCEDDPERSNVYYKRIVEEYPEDSLASVALFALGQYSYAKGDYYMARNLFRGVFDRYSKSDIAVEALYWSANSLLLLERGDSAREEFQSIILKFPQSRKALWAHLGIGDVYFKARKFLLALNEYQEIENKFPNSEVAGIAAYKTGLTYEKLGAKEEAIASYRSVLDISPLSYESAAAKKRIALLSTDTSSTENITQKETVKEERGFHLQVGAFVTKEQALSLKESLQKEGYDVIVKRKRVARKDFYVVIMGSYETKEKARKAGEEIKSKKGMDWLIYED